MDVVAHALWAQVLLPGSVSWEKAVFGILPDIVVFIPDLISTTVRGEKRDFTTRKEMMDWYAKPQNRWKTELYKWTHSLLLWSILIGIISFYSYYQNQTIHWFMFGAILHILLDIPTHTNDSFPVEFLTPVSSFKINGWHWSNKKMIIANYFLLVTAFYIRLFLFGKFF